MKSFFINRIHFVFLIPLFLALGFLLPFVSLAQSDVCTAAPLITSGITCSNTAGNVAAATYVAGPSIACGTPKYDVWYSFVAQSTNPTIKMTSVGTNIQTPVIQLFSGTCAALTSLGCSTAAAGVYTIAASALTIGNTYFIRVFATSGGAVVGPATLNTFNICITDGAPANDDCAGAVTLTSGSTCVNTPGNMYASTLSAVAIAPCLGPATYDVWYKFTAKSANPTISLSSIGSNITGPGLQLFTGATCAALTGIDCGTTSLSANGLTIGTVYFVRVYATGALPTTSVNSDFNICIVDAPPDNDLCSNATVLTSAAACTNTSGTLSYATATAGVPSACAGATATDVWYKFVAQTTTPVITLSSLGASFTTPVIDLLKGTCGSLTSVNCISGLTLTGAGLTVGQTYYIRISSSVANPSGTGWGFNICVTETIASIDFSKGYINVSKGTNGGTVDPGDTLEMRLIFVVKSNSADSLQFLDTLYHTKGLAYVPGSLSLQTNEGKLYKPFTDIIDVDAGSVTKAGLDTVIKVNFGTGATASARGRLLNTSKPSVFTATCIIMVTYRVVVYAPYNTKINFKNGSLTYRDGLSTTMHNVNFQSDSLVVFQSPGLCPNSVSAVNAIGIESNGTFGVPAGTPPFLRNRGTSAYTNYTYMPFNSSGGPKDYYYGITNNSSGVYSLNQNLIKPDPSNQRVFQVWDIIGDHTGAVNSSKGNPPCDITQPVSASNPCGYMIVVNSAYRADTAFQYTATNLCPSTYYEISAWFRNICSRCSCDSNGVGHAGAGYLPTAPGDSSGVRPNIAFDVNGYDYYTTGSIPNYGIGFPNDTLNKWVKRGFTYLTGPAETSIRLTLRNNAPGGGGNDWAMDDIGIKNCLPNMKYSPTLNPNVCGGNIITISDTVQSFFNTYQNSKWQRSTDSGATWTDVTAATTFSNSLVGGNYQYVTSFTIDSSQTHTSNNKDIYRVIVGTTISNVGNTNCAVTDGVNQILLSVTNCGTPLNSELLSFNGKLVNDHGNLSWTTVKEYEQLQFEVEKSNDGNNFTKMKTVNGLHNSNETNYYYFNDPDIIKHKAWYRIIMINSAKNRKYSRTIILSNEVNNFEIVNLINPFQNALYFDIALTDNAKIDVMLTTMNGMPIKKQSFYAYGGINSLNLANMKTITRGIYLLQIRNKDKIIIKKVIKN